MPTLPPEVSVYQARTVEYSSGGKLLMGGIIFLVLMMTLVAFGKDPEGKQRPLAARAIPLGLSLVVGVVFVLQMQRTRRILQEGELAAGTVRLTYRGGHGPRILFQYADGIGTVHQGSVRGRHTDSYRQGQVIPVMYDRAQPQLSATPIQRFFDVRPVGR